MQYYEILVTQEYTAAQSVFTYASTDDLVPMQYVIVPLQNKQATGIVVKKVPKPSFVTKQIVQAFPFGLQPNQQYILRFLKDYYSATEAQALQLFLPSFLTKLVGDRPAVTEEDMQQIDSIQLPKLTHDQDQALNLLEQNASDTVVLHGDTGTGKTRLYIERARSVLASNKIVLILSPEIALIPQLQQVLTTAFGKDIVASYHSTHTATQRAHVWRGVQDGSIKIIIGTRSALFLPLKNIGLIVVDEAHEPAYKQDEGVRYHAARVASVLASYEKAQLILASATPLVGDIYLAQKRGKTIIRMQQTAITSDTHTSVAVIDMKAKDEFNAHPLLSHTLLKAIESALQKGEQSLVYLNRRGTARAIICSTCGWQAACPTCNVALTYHHDHHRLRCHTCGFSQNVPSSCPICSSPDILFKSAGTKALAAWLQKHFSSAAVGRFDTDNSKAESLSERHSDVASGAIDILVGTQMLVKGLDLPKLSVVGIVAADLSLQMPDFSAEERTYQLLNQAIGRVGRGHRNGSVIIQTFNPDNKVIQQAISKNYDDFYTTQIDQRTTFDFAPVTFMATLWTSRKTAASALEQAQKILKLISKSTKASTFLGPVITFHPKKRGYATAQIVVKTKHRTELSAIAKSLPSGWQYDLEPIDLL